MLPRGNRFSALLFMYDTVWTSLERWRSTSVCLTTELGALFLIQVQGALRMSQVLGENSIIYDTAWTSLERWSSTLFCLIEE